MCHWCPEETMAVLSVLPFLSAGLIWVRARYHKWLGKPPICGHTEHACKNHNDKETQDGEV